VSTTSFAAALGWVTKYFIGRTGDAASRRPVAEAETNRTLLSSRAECRFVSASVECGSWQHSLLGRRDQKDIRTQGGTLARGTRLRLPWAMISIPYGESETNAHSTGKWASELN